MAIYFVALLAGANMRVLDILLPVISDDLVISPFITSKIVISFTMGYGISQFVFGALGDKFGKTNVIRYAVLISCISSFVSFYFDNLNHLFFSRFFTGIGVGGIIPLTIAKIGDETPYSFRQEKIAKFLGVVLLGNFLGPLASGLISVLLSWQIVFFFFGIFFLAGFFCINTNSSNTIISFDNFFKKSINFILVSYTIYKNILKLKWSKIILFTVFSECFLFYGTLTFIGVYLNNVLNISLIVCGFIVSFFGLGGIFYSVFAKKILLLLNQKKIVLVGSILIFINFTLIPFFSNFIIITILIFFAGVGFYMFHNTIQVNSSEMYPSSRGASLGIHAFFVFIGQSLGIYFFSKVFNLLNYKIGFSFSAISILILGLYFSNRLNKFGLVNK